MNILGPSVRTTLRAHDLLPSSLVVIHDELRLAPLKLKAQPTLPSKKFAQSGHGGLKSITAALSTRAFHRIQVGIGNPGAGGDVPVYVLDRLSATEKRHWSVDGEGVEQAWMVLERIARQVEQTQVAQAKAQAQAAEIRTSQPGQPGE